ncbi:SPOR domain-containing protein [Tropicibacter sp. Alg240-R139]|uniref:SPOR domain-containing protein n=1 Tax=Tropicibacter sp. Alg240-R139 TaxID=2305991 RepID=UPI0013DFCD53|nr:SPOR domain-containing protein [Tropicibacter sp. Alg240-R139]
MTYGAERRTEPRKLPKRLVLFAATLGILAGCEEGPNMSFLQPKDKETTTEESGQSTQLIERDVEAPEVFEVTEAGLWDGRPSLGGVWVAHADVTEPERVIIRNASNGKFVIGALFRRAREIPGPRIQASSDAAAALGMLAGSPVELHVTALRREAVEEAPEIDATEVAVVEPEAEISEATLDPIAGAAAAIDATVPATAEAPVVTASASAATPAPKPKSSSLSKPYIQIGIFSVEANANRTADQMRNSGMVPTVLAQKSNGKSFWRVVVGPAQSTSERTALLKQVKETGFSDAYAVTN